MSGSRFTRRPVGPSITEAMQSALAGRRICKEHRRNQELAAAQFERFLGARAGEQAWPPPREWIASFLDDCERRELKPRTVRAYFNCLAVTQQWAQDTGIVPESEALFPRRRLPKPEPPRKQFLLPEMVLWALRVTPTHAKTRTLKLTLALCGFAGLRLTEVCRITPDDLRDDGCLVIRKAKNDSSRRVIPLPDVALTVLREHLARWGKADRPLYRNTSTLSHTLRHGFEALASRPDAPHPEVWRACTPHEAGRKTFANLAAAAGVGDVWTRAYYGHAASNTYESHYWMAAPKPDDLPPLIERALLVLKREVADKIDGYLVQTVGH